MVVNAPAAPRRAVDDVDRPARPAQAPVKRTAAVGRRLAFIAAILFTGAVAAVVVWHIRSGRRRRQSSSPPLMVADPRPRILRAALSAIDLRRRPPRAATLEPDRFVDALRALRRPPAPRVLPYVVVKRINPRVGDTFGHWWMEIDRTESYGWWPHRCPIRVRDFFFGGRGTLNGLGGSCGGGTTMTDPHHLDPAQHAFHPRLVVRKSDRRVRADIRAFAHAFSGGWRWSTKPTTNECRSFQLQLFEAVGLDEGEDYLHTRGQGCTFLALVRPRQRAFATGTPRSTH